MVYIRLYIPYNPREATTYIGKIRRPHYKCSVLTIPYDKSGVLGTEVPHTCLWEDIREYSLIRKPRINDLADMVLS